MRGLGKIKGMKGNEWGAQADCIETQRLTRE